jgi:hypothetical protein
VCSRIKFKEKCFYPKYGKQQEHGRLTKRGVSQCIRFAKCYSNDKLKKDKMRGM